MHYDEDVLYLWPRNLNTDQQVHDLAEDSAATYIETGAAAAGYTADEYGQNPSASRTSSRRPATPTRASRATLMGLRNVLGILVETRVDADPMLDPMELADAAMVNRRRVDSHLTVIDIALGFLAKRGDEVAAATAGARARKTREGAEGSAPVYFGGADNAGAHRRADRRGAVRLPPHSRAVGGGRHAAAPARREGQGRRRADGAARRAADPAHARRTRHAPQRGGHPARRVLSAG